MASSWPSVQLGDVVELTTGFPFNSNRYAEDPAGIRLLRGDNVAQGVLQWDGAKRWPCSEVESLQEYLLKEGDVILAMDRPWIDRGLKYASIRSVDLPALLVQRVARLRGKERLDTRYLMYIIGGEAFTNYILGTQTGTTIPHISAGQIRGFRFALPPLPVQHAIATRLGMLDDKIELNRRMNETLEVMARALFKSWFIDFDPVRAKAEGRDPGLPADIAALYPDSFQDSELGEIPKGWRVKGLDEIADFLNGLALQTFPPHDGRSIPIIKIAQLRAGNTQGADATSANLDAKYVVDDGDVLFSWSGSLECVLWTGGLGALNQHLFKVTSAVYPKWFYYYWIQHHLGSFREIAAGKATTMGHIQRHHLSGAKVVVPGRMGLDAVDKALSPIFRQLVQLRLESRTLATLRDTLLPKLLSGELRVPQTGEPSKGLS